jgi:diadenosine tetraphosphate (Ap4A) HIT family hydrolase
MGARNLLDLKPDELRDLLVTVQKAAIAQRKALRQPVSKSPKIMGSAAAKPFTTPIFA